MAGDDLAAALEAAAKPAVRAAAQAIAADWRAGAAMHLLKTADPAVGVVVEEIDGVTVVQTHNPIGHIDEFGSINSAPTGAARSAANRHGQFTPGARS
jgi:hypothetical protein